MIKKLLHKPRLSLRTLGAGALLSVGIAGLVYSQEEMVRGNIVAAIEEASLTLSAASGEMVLSAEEERLARLLEIDRAKFGKYLKYGPLTVRVKETSYAKSYTYFYQASQKGNLSPIGRRYITLQDGQPFSTSWSVIRGAGENELLWQSIRPTVGVTHRAGTQYSEFQEINYYGANDALRLVVPRTVMLSEEATLLEFVRGLRAFADDVSSDKTVQRELRSAKKSDDKAQGYCESSVYVVENIASTTDVAGKVVYAYDMVSVLGDVSALAQFGLGRYQGLSRYRVDFGGMISKISPEPLRPDAYNILDVPRCRA